MHRARVGGRYESYRCANRSCVRKAGINLPQLEAYAVAEVLKQRGGEFLMKVEIRHEGGDLIEIEAAIRDTAAAMQEDSADMAALSLRLENLKEARARAREGVRVVHEVQDATVFRKAWPKATSIADQRALIRGQLDGLVIAPGDKARNRFDPARVTFEWRVLHADDDQR
jgi:hypothetical protein